ncbi:hypothetical protein ACFVH6_02735 [Spirillospora sp. NPDC127200]
MQLPRVVIAAVFFVIGALIAIPALMETTGESRASGAPTATTSAPTPTGTGTGGGPTPTPTRTTAPPSPTHSASPTATTKPPTPSPTRTTTGPPQPVQPLSVTVGNVRCPGRTVEVTVRNAGSQAEDFAIVRDDGSASVPSRVAAGASRSTTVTLREDRRTQIQVTWKNEPLRTQYRTANCKKAAPGPSRTPREELPHTGADDGVLWARTATGAAAMVTGLIIFWYGGIWPRRRDKALTAGKRGR